MKCKNCGVIHGKDTEYCSEYCENNMKSSETKTGFKKFWHIITRPFAYIAELVYYLD